MTNALPQPRTRWRVLLLVAVLTLVWGTNWGLFPLAVKEVSVWTFRSISLLCAGSLLLLTARAKGLSLHVPPRERRPLVLAAVTYLVVWNIASTYAAVYLPSGQAAILGFTMPVWAVALSWLVLRERPSLRLFASVTFAACGVGILAYGAREAYASAPAGFALGLLAAIGWAVGTLILKRGRLTMPTIVSTGWQLLIAGVPITSVALVLGEGQFFMPSWTTVLVIAYITTVPMSLGNVTWFSIVSILPASISGLSAVLVPMVAMVTGALFFREPLGPLQWAAMACCATAMALALSKRSGG